MSISLETQIKSLRTQLEVLAARLSKASEKELPGRPLSDLRGILRDQSRSTEEEIDAAVLRSPTDEPQ